MEFLVLASSFRKEPERERTVMKATIEAAKATSANLVLKIRGNVYSPSVYFKHRGKKILVYNDWNKDLDWKEVYERILTSIQSRQFSNSFRLATQKLGR